MPDISSIIRMDDYISPVLSNILSSIDITITAMERLDSVSNNLMNINSFDVAIDAIANTTSYVEDLINNISQFESIQISSNSVGQVNGLLETMHGHIQEATQAQVGLSDAMDRMDIASTNEAFLRLNGAIDSTDNHIRDNIDGQDRFNDSVNRGAAGALGILGTVKKYAGAFLGSIDVKKVFDFGKDSVNAANIQIAAEAKLETVMRRRMGANDDMIQSVKDLALEQQKLGVVGDEVQLGGAQQLATFLTQKDSLASLMPAMNNLAVQQAMSEGGDVTPESMNSIGNMMGEAMQGETSALTRVGITFDAEQEGILKYGTELERASMLAEAISQNVGDMNAAMLSTPQGLMKNISNDFGNMMETVGYQLYPALLDLFGTIKENMPLIENIMLGIGSGLSVVVTIVTYVIDIVMLLGGAVGDFVNFAVPAIGALVGAFAALRIVKGVAAGFAFFKDVLGMASIGMLKFAKTTLLANWPLLLIGGVIVGLIYAFINWKDKTAEVIGVITGCLFSLVAFFYNVLYVTIANTILTLVEFFQNVWNNPIAAVKNMFYGFALTVVEMVASMAEAIENFLNAIPGVKVDITSNIEAMTDTIRQKKKELEEDSNLITLERVKELDYGEMFNKGNSIGKDLSGKTSDGLISGVDKIKDMFGLKPWENPNDGAGMNYEVLGNSLGDSLGDKEYDVNVKDEVNLSDDSLKYLLDGVATKYVNNVNLSSPAPTLTVNVKSDGGIVDYDSLAEKSMKQFASMMAEMRESSTDMVYV